MRLKKLYGALMLLAAPAIADDILPALPGAAQCEITSSQQHIDFGQQSYGRYQVINEQQRQMSPGVRRLNITALCAYPESLAIRFNGSQTASGDFAHGARGALQMTLKKALLDGKPVDLQIKHPQQHERYLNADFLLLPQMEIAPTGSNHAVLQGKQFTLSIEIQPVINAQGINNQILSQSHFNVQLVKP